MAQNWTPAPYIAAMALRINLRKMDAQMADVCASPSAREDWLSVRPNVLRVINRLECSSDPQACAADTYVGERP